MWPELKRKAFHFCSMIYVIGLVLLPRGFYVGLLSILTFIIFILEIWRLRSPWFESHIVKIFGPLMRDHENRKISGLFWMLLGITLTCLLVRPITVAATAILYLIIGDAMASLIGMRWGGPHWPGQKKRISGSLACFLSCFLVGAVLLRPDFGWNGVWAGALTATVAEYGLLPIDDNVIIPVASALVLMLCYGLTPGF